MNNERNEVYFAIFMTLSRHILYSHIIPGLSRRNKGKIISKKLNDKIISWEHELTNQLTH